MKTMTSMKWASSLSIAATMDAALAEVLTDIKAKLAGVKPDVVFMFVSPHHRSHYTQLSTAINKQLGPQHILGCSGGGIIGAAHEAEQVPALSVTAAVMPNVDIHPFHIRDSNLPDLDSGPRNWENLVGAKPGADLHFVLVADPFSIRAEDLLAGLDYAFPKSVKIGGLASGARGPGQHALFLDHFVHLDGAVGLALSGDIQIDPLVAQGCRPVGKLMAVTKCHRNLLLELDKRRSLDVLGELIEQASERDKQLIKSTSLFLGLVMDPFKNTQPGPGDFLIRQLMGMDEKRGILQIASTLNEGQNVQFHLFDAQAASDDVNAVLRRYATERLNSTGGEALPSPPRGALLFSCLGRGIHLYGRPDHDTHAFQSQLGDVPLAGFFCNGEIGPVGGTTYIHGWTSCFGIFRTRS